jgi:hypothetical protein
MKIAAIFISCLWFLISCRENDNIPDIAGIPVNLKLERFEKDFFSIDTTDPSGGLSRLGSKYPVLSGIFINNILGLDSNSAAAGVIHFIRLTRPVYDTASIVFRDLGSIYEGLQEAFRYVKYYFPSYPVPQVNTIIGPLDAMAQTTTGYSPDFMGPGFLAVSLQFYLGKNYSAYRDPYFIDNIAPAYRSRRFSKEYIVPDAMMLVVDDLFPDNSKSRPLIEQMIERGKQWWLLDKFTPRLHDTLKTGFTGEQLEWCLENEGMIWSYIVKNENLNSLEPATIQTYLGEGPFTQGFSQEYSPGNMGQWLGWRIVKKFEERNPAMKPEQIMQMDPRKLLEESKYKPK